MFPQSNHSPLRRHRIGMLRFTNLIALLLLTGLFISSQAQNNFNSGSTGADGAFAPATSQSIQVPASGVFHYTTINIPAGVTITYTRNATNTPVTILASGNVTIAGTLVISGQAGATSGNGGIGGPGGFDGGSGGLGLPIYNGNPGVGPGGGTSGKYGTTAGTGAGGGGGGFNIAGTNGGGETAARGVGGPKYGTNTLLPLIGGSGGGGGGASLSARGASGGGGAGAILLASSGTITFSGSAAINAQGGVGGAAATSGANFGAGGGGSGGAIRLIANTISGPATLNVNGGAGGACWSGGCGGAGGLGYVRIEAFDVSAFTPTGSPQNLSYAAPNPVALTTAPQLRIASVAGVASPTTPVGSFQAAPDIVVPASQSNPVTVALEAANIPLGTVVQVTLTPASGARTTVSSTALAGTEAASTGSASLTLPSGMSVISAAAVCDLTLAKARPMFIDGERVRSFEVAAVFGGQSEVTYITESGRRIRKSD
jgi:hypothetical protein